MESKSVPNGFHSNEILGGFATAADPERESGNLGPEASDVIMAGRSAHELHSATGGYEGILKEREFSSPVYYGG